MCRVVCVRVCVCGGCACVLRVSVVYVLRMCVWDVRFVFWSCGVLCCVVMCGVGADVGAQCVVVVCVCVRWCVCVVCVWRGLARGKPRVSVKNVSVCRFKTPACVQPCAVCTRNSRACETSPVFFLSSIPTLPQFAVIAMLKSGTWDTSSTPWAYYQSILPCCASRAR